MKIVFVNRFYAPDHSATSQMLTDLASALAAGGADVHVVTSRLRYEDASAALAPEETIDGVRVHRVRTSAFGRGSLLGRAFDYLSFYLTASLRLFGLVGRGDVVVAKTDPPLISVPVGWVSRLRGARTVNWLQYLFPEVAAELGMKLAQGASGRLLRWLRNDSLRRAATNVVLGRVMHERVKALGVDPRQVVTISNWADGTAVRPVEHAANPLRREWGLDGKFVVGYSGNMGRVHEFDTIVGAANALAAQPDIVFLFVGDGAQRATIEAAATESGLTNLLFRPYQPRELLDRSLGAVDVHLVTLRPELEGLVVPSKFYGIAAAGRPVLMVGDPEGEIGAVVRESECGLCVRQGDSSGLVAAIVQLRSDPGLQERLGRNSRRVLEGRFDKGTAMEKWRRLLEGVAVNSSG